MTGRFANIIIDISHEKLDRIFQYLIPDELEGKLGLGCCVLVPFGMGNRLIKGYVVEITDKADYDTSKMKYINSLSLEGVGASGDILLLAAWIKQSYGSTMIAALKTALPIKQSVKPVVKKTIVCRADADTAKAMALEFESRHQTAKARLMRELVREQAIPQKLVTDKLNISASTIKSLVNAGLAEVTEEKTYRSALPENMQTADTAGVWGKKRLSKSQQAVVDGIYADFSNGIHKTYLLHGVTGSGKTEVYMELVELVVKAGKQAIVLIPEIALTYQTLIRFYKRFGDRVSVMNSKLSKGERFDQYQKAADGSIDIMIGPRSALFTPFERLGIVIIDEEHEASYKSESVPKYHAREVAEKLCEIKGASLLLGSATPSIESYYRAQNGAYRLFELNERLTGAELPKVYIDDLRIELKEGNRSVFGRRLKRLIQDRLEKKEQSMLFINRRGYAGFVSCRACGHVMKCPHCDVSLSEHTDGPRQSGVLVCHYCGYQIPNVTVCPSCGSRYILGFRAGTQQIEERLKKEFPNARILRMDADTTKNKDGYERILSQFANEQADILVGTQMIVKGHDFPKVTLVGILAADMSLHSGDYRAAERTFQLLTQAAGRAGRGALAGEVVIQTYQPENYAVVHAANQDYKSFYTEEMAYRELMHYPPTSQMMAILVLSDDELKGDERAGIIADIVKRYSDGKNAVVIGPSRAAIGKINDIYRNTVYVKHGKYEFLTEIKDVLENYIKSAGWREDSVQFDFNPLINY